MLHFGLQRQAIYLKGQDQTITRLHICRLLNVGSQRQAIYYLKMKDQTIVRLNICRLLNVCLQRQAVYFLKERSNNYEVKYLSVTKCWFKKTSNLFFK